MIKWKGVRPKYTTVEEVKERIDTYFKECEEEGNYPTVSGLACEMGMARQTLARYKDILESDDLKHIDDVSVRKAISTTIKEAYDHIQNGYEEKLVNGKTQSIGVIFALKNNFGWVDRQETVVENKTISVSLEDEEE